MLGGRGEVAEEAGASSPPPPRQGIVHGLPAQRAQQQGLGRPGEENLLWDESVPHSSWRAAWSP